MIPLDKLEIGQCYELESRNLQRGVWDGKAFHGIRYKFGDLFIDSEIHYDLDERYGTAKAICLLEICQELNEMEEVSNPIDDEGVCIHCGQEWTGTL